MICEDCEVAACYCDGLPEAPIESITLEDIIFTYNPDSKSGIPAMRNFAEKLCRVGMYFDNVSTLTVKNVTLSGHEGEDLVAKNVKTLERS